MSPAEDEFAWMKALSQETGVPVTYGLLQSPLQPQKWRDMLALTEQARLEGAKVTAQIACRPTGMVLGWQSSIHPFIARASYRAIADRPFAERLVELKKPEVRAAILSEPSPDLGPLGMILTNGFDRMFRLENGEALDYEPRAEDSVAALAKTTGKPADAIVYDMLMERDGRGYIYLPLLNYGLFNFDHILEMMRHPATILSLSDGGAHCGVICDASFPTYMLTYWARDRVRGDKMPLERVIQMQTHDTAKLYGLDDRGVVAPGMKADLNVIDLERLRILAPEMAFDLPAEGRRLIQKAQGYRATIVSGAVTFEDGVATGEMPGKLVRGPQAPKGVVRRNAEAALA
jgi:N-acyl-D-amino-acid deacylase